MYNLRNEVKEITEAEAATVRGVRADEETGLTFGVFMFQDKSLAVIKAKDGETRPAPYFKGEPVTMPMAEMFKIKNGKIRDVEAIGIRLPYGMGSGWE
jgi:hypothetical protein